MTIDGTWKTPCHGERQASGARGHRRRARRAPAQLRRVRLTARARDRLDARHPGRASADPAGGPHVRRGEGPADHRDRPARHRLLDAVPLPERARLDGRSRDPARHARHRHRPDHRPVRRRTVRAGRRRRAARPDPRRRACSVAWRRPGAPTRRRAASSSWPSAWRRCWSPRGCRWASRSPAPSGWSGHSPAPASICTPRCSRRATRTCSRGRSSRRCSSTTC